MSNSISMPSDEWNSQDGFWLHLHSPAYPVEQGAKGFEKILDFIESMEGSGSLDTLLSGKRRRKYSRKAVREIFLEQSIEGHTSFAVECSNAPWMGLWISLSEKERSGRLFVSVNLTPFSIVRQPGAVEDHTRRILSWVRSFASLLPVTYGFGHSSTDFSMGTNPLVEDPFAPYRVDEVYWLNVYGPQLVSEMGREHVLSTPASVIEELPGGAVLLLTRPTPADFDSEEARLAQARALVHLRPELKLETILDTLRQRSRVFVPIPVHFDEDVADILQKKLAFEGLENKRRMVERFNLYRPPPVSEWLPAEQAPAPDVEDVKQAIDTYERLYAEQLVALMHSQQVPEVTEGTLEALAAVDFTLWHLGWGERFTAEEKEALIPALGAWLGMYLVSALGGQWVPRRKLEETAVRVGGRAWLPFLRARHALQHGEAPLDYSCSQFFRQAQRSTRPTA
ncbi:hypothetical protein F0U62_27450 [Cystobacter fuscus]|nr:hypothetical protein F0U62_27450 [Cystobacter fuscus]